MKTTAAVAAQLKAIADPHKVKYKADKYDIHTDGALGVYQADLKEIAKQIGWNSELALELWDCGIYEARLVASKIFKPTDLTLELAEKWVAEFDNWEICDSFSMAVFGKSPLAIELIRLWKDREPEYEKRAAYATMVVYVMANKRLDNATILALLPWIESAATDERNFVKKAVNWALRTIGKRNVDLKAEAIHVSNGLLTLDSKSAHWIAKNALSELQKPNVTMQDHPRSIYRP